MAWQWHAQVFLEDCPDVLDADMTLFNPDTPHISAGHKIIYARYELLHTLVDFAAAILFVFGSVLFFFPSTTYAATWMFLIGSLCFAAKPSIRLTRELKMARLGESAQPSDLSDE